jgi:hypothetical protein
MKSNFRISGGWFCKHIFLTLPSVKRNCIYAELCKNLSKVVKIRMFI